MYDQYYGLSEAPFQLTPDPRYWFESATHAKAMAYLGYGLTQGEGFVVITGEIGAGKTTLVRLLLDKVDDGAVLPVSITSTQVDPEDMLRLVAQGMGIETEGLEKAQLIDRIEYALEQLGRAGRRLLLIIDEAQGLSVPTLEELRMLSNQQYSGRAVVQIFLLGQPEFREKLQGSNVLEQLRQRVIAMHHLAAMSEAEIEPYVRYRLAQASWRGQPNFAPEVWSKLYQASDGVPRRLNLLMGRVLLAAALEEKPVIDSDVVAMVAADQQADGLTPVVTSAPVAAEPMVQNIATRGNGVTMFQRPVELDRITALEARLAEQEEALRRVLSIMVDWIEQDQDRAQHTNAA
jgi:general secretion pathway protein A